MTLTAYAPRRDLAAKVRRRMTQWRAARPTVLRFDAPILSVCFDDFPVSAVETGATILETHGARGTFYAAVTLSDKDGPCGRNFSADHLRRLANAGHEIGCHTHTHADCATQGTFDTLQDIAANRDALAAMGAAAPATLAYPYGETTLALKSALPPRIACARGVLPGLNVGRTDLMQLRAHPLFGADAMTRVLGALREAVRRRGWLIVFTHDVSDSPSPWGTPARDLDALLRTARSSGVSVLPVSAALARRR